MRLFFVGILLLLVLASADHKISTFEDVDTDSDGHVTLSEFEKSQRAMTPEPPESTIRAIFGASDLNGDQQLSPDEYSTLVRNLRADAETQADEIFKALDTNGDGRLELKEAEKAASIRNLSLLSVIEGVFNVSDINKDGVLSQDEFKVFSGTNINEQSPLSGEEIVSTTPGTILALVDTNGDGAVSLPELRVFAVQFEDVDTEKANTLYRSMDANNDGLIDGDELIPLHARLAEMIRSPIPGGVIPNAKKLT
uniref:EF-hand domain-containing protein n=1 Tax=Plectus sambesii TaxID=2011161 RepID=A0A914VXQ7_9BILA